MNLSCQHCDTTFESSGSRGRTPKYCSARCRKAAQRARKAPQSPAFPSEMVSAGRWVRADKKRPIRVDGSPASTTNPRTWSTFDEVQTGAGDGVGFMLGGGFACLDLDHCVDDRGQLSPLAESIVAKNPGAFIEVSMSGRGLHVFGYLPPRRGRKMPGVEVYSDLRFIRTTGKTFQSGGLEVLKF